MCSISACSEVQTCFPILPHTLHHRHNLLHTGNTHTHTNMQKNEIKKTVPLNSTLVFYLVFICLLHCAVLLFNPPKEVI